MSGKKKDNERFNNPFSALEGLPVSGKPDPRSEEPAAAPVTGEETPADSAELPEEVDFSEAMAGLGVRKIKRGGLEKQAPGREQDAIPEGFRPGTPEPLSSGGSGVARPRRAKLLRRGDITPQAECDLHGVTSGEVAQKVGWFLENAVFHGFEAVRIITGKGGHSADGPILRPLVETYLDGPGRRWVIEWMRAPQKQGGEGAFIVFLRVKPGG